MPRTRLRARRSAKLLQNLPDPLDKPPARPRATGAVILIVFAMLTVVAALLFFAGFALVVL